jgi:hypothetical protein
MELFHTFSSIIVFMSWLVFLDVSVLTVCVFVSVYAYVYMHRYTHTHPCTVMKLKQVSVLLSVLTNYLTKFHASYVGKKISDFNFFIEIFPHLYLCNISASRSMPCF